MNIFRKLWSLAALIAAIDFMADPNRGIRNAFRVAATPGPNFFERGAHPKRKLPDPLSEAEAKRLQREGLETLRKAALANQQALDVQ